jgi:hypothetical protein
MQRRVEELARENGEVVGKLKAAEGRAQGLEGAVERVT